TGYELGTTVFVEAASGTSTATTSSTTGPTTGMTGTIHAAVIVTNFSDTTNPFSMASIQAAFNGSPGHDVDSFFSEVSYNKTTLGPNCTTPLYADTFDTMGSAPYAWQETPHYDAYHKALAGWFTAANYPTVSSPGSYSYTLAPIESSSTGTVALNIPRGDSGT